MKREANGTGWGPKRTGEGKVNAGDRERGEIECLI